MQKVSKILIRIVVAFAVIFICTVLVKVFILHPPYHGVWKSENPYMWFDTSDFKGEMLYQGNVVEIDIAAYRDKYCVDIYIGTSHNYDNKIYSGEIIQYGEWAYFQTDDGNLKYWLKRGDS